MQHKQPAGNDIIRNFHVNKNIEKSSLHNIVFGIKQLNVEIIERKLLEVSDPSSTNYGSFLTRKEISSICSNPTGYQKLTSYLIDQKIDIIHKSLYHEYIIARAPLHKWEKVLSTKFHEYTHIETKQSYIRALDYKIPLDIAIHIDGVFNITRLPTHSFSHIKIESYKSSSNPNSNINSITPLKLMNYYHIFTNDALFEANQTIFSSVSQYFSSSDMQLFQSTFHIPLHPVDSDPNHRNNPEYCRQYPNYCLESSLDLEYIMAIAQGSQTTIT